MELEKQLRIAGIDVALLRQMACQNNESNDYQLEDSQTTDVSGIQASLPDEDNSPLNDASYSLEVESKSFDHEEFIDRLKELPCLWKTSISSYKDRIVKLNAWRKLAKLFDRDSECLIFFALVYGPKCVFSLYKYWRVSKNYNFFQQLVC